MSRIFEELSGKVPATTTNATNPFLEAAAECGGCQFGNILLSTKGEWHVGDETVEHGTKFLALVDQTMRGWQKFVGGKPERQVIGRVADHFKPPERDTLGDTEEEDWNIGSDGRPRDPWTLQWFLPLMSEGGELYTFITGSKGGADAIRDLLHSYGMRLDGVRPIVRLSSRSYRHPDYAKIIVPELPITSWTRPTEEPPPGPPIRTLTSPQRMAEEPDTGPEPPPWRDFPEGAVRTPTAKKIVERVMVEHMKHAGKCNGRLIVTYDDFAKYGIWRSMIANAIKTAVHLGFLDVTVRGRRSHGIARRASRYGLTWLPWCDGTPASNRWLREEGK